MKKLSWVFYECEHSGDLDNYLNDLIESGALITSSEVDHEAEKGLVDFEVEDYNAFKKKFKETDSFGFQENR